jgi:gamma-glutamylcyclotransferase (GGCT)/AIG2-like uncharacterized protein YtfP
MFYFAYGSNMDHHQMLVERCPGASFVGPAVLDEHCLFFDGYSAYWAGAVANIDALENDEVWGGLFEITETHFNALDEFEGCPRYYSRKLIDVIIQGTARKVAAWTYYREPHPVGTPSRRYIEAVLRGARDCCLPEEYIMEVFSHYMGPSRR